MFTQAVVQTQRPVIALALSSVVCLVALMSGLPMAGPLAKSIGCVMLLVFGLPHGTLDLELIKARSEGSWTDLASLLVIYLGCAAAMYAIWVAAPVLALTAFIVIAVVHFSEDWDGAGSTLLTHGLALAVLAAPSFLHRADLTSIFIALTNRPDAGAVTDLLTLIAPVAGILGLVAIVALWSVGRRTQAVAASVALIGMVVLPPIVGFALYFCLFHSPRHLGESLRAVPLPKGRAWLWVIVPLTLAAAAISGAIYGLELRPDLPSRLVAASFMTLSILTVPHMLAPTIVRRLANAKLSGGKAKPGRRRSRRLHA